MRQFAFFVFGLCSLLSAAKAQSAKPDFEVFCHEFLQEKPAIKNYETIFSKDFRDQVSAELLLSIFTEVFQETGKCTHYGIQTLNHEHHILSLFGEKHLKASFKITVDTNTGLIIGFLSDGIEDPRIKIKTWKDIEAAFKILDQNGMYAASLVSEDRSTNLNFNPAESLAVGSTFKLFVLGALETAISESHGSLSWNKTFPIQEIWKSLPSGIMQEWPEGKEVTLLEYAEKMISISDNTATDHLLGFLSKETVEKSMVKMGNQQRRNFPLLSTLEMFKLKWAIPQKDTDEYLAADIPTKRKMLDQLKQVPRTAVGTNGVSLENPTLIRELEWFATTSENCKAMFYLISTGSPEIRSILSKSVPGIQKGNTHWTYAGYKGGSEPGVISMTYVLESKTGKRACLSMSWNNPEKNISSFRFQDLVQKTLKFAEGQIPQTSLQFAKPSH